MGFAERVLAVNERGVAFGHGANSGVDGGAGVPVCDAAAGEYAVLIRASGSGCKCDRQVTPVDHVGRDGVSPMHVAPNGGSGIELVEHVVLAVPVDRAVGVVYPVATR